MTPTITSSITELIKEVNQADSAPKLVKSVTALAQSKSPEAIPTLIEVLGFNNPGAAVAATEGLISLGEIVIEPLLQSLDEYNYGARAWALRVFAGIGDIRALELLIKAATADFALSVRRAATKGLGNLQWHQLSPSEIIPTQKQVFHSLMITSQDGEWVVRYASIVALENFYQSLKQYNHEDLIPKIREKLSFIQEKDDEIGLQSRAKLALLRITQEI